MKLLYTILFLFLVSCSKSQSFFNHLIKNGVTSNSVSNVKNIQPISADSVYDAFGSLFNVSANKDVQFFRRGITHTTGGQPFYRFYNESANHWYAPVQFANTVKDCRDVYATKMDNDSISVFYGDSNNGVGGDWGIDLKIQKCDINMNFSTPVDFNWAAVPVKLQRHYFFNGIPHGDNPGEYYCVIMQFNVDTGATRYRQSVIKTTDYWNNYTEVGVIFDGTIPSSETSLAYLGSGKFIALTRIDNSGILVAHESSNNCVTWTNRGTSNLYWYIVGEAEIPYVYPHDGVFDIIYQCRDADMVHISRNNTVASNFGVIPAIYNGPEIYAHHLGTGGNPSLGYPQRLKMQNGSFLNTYAKQFNNNRANLFWTRDNGTDPAGVPEAPVLSTSAIGTTLFRVDITNYTDKNIENIRYFQQDISTHADFSDFVTCKYRISTSGAYPAVVMHDIKMQGLWDVYHDLTTATTYYLRIKACNNTGCSAYTTTSATTLGFGIAIIFAIVFGGLLTHIDNKKIKKAA